MEINSFISDHNACTEVFWRDKSIAFCYYIYIIAVFSVSVWNNKNRGFYLDLHYDF